MKATKERHRWTTRVLSGVLRLASLVVTQEQPAHFALADPSAATASQSRRPAGRRILADLVATKRSTPHPFALAR